MCRAECSSVNWQTVFYRARSGIQLCSYQSAINEPIGNLSRIDVQKTGCGHVNESLNPLRLLTNKSLLACANVCTLKKRRSNESGLRIIHFLIQAIRKRPSKWKVGEESRRKQTCFKIELNKSTCDWHVVNSFSAQEKAEETPQKVSEGLARNSTV